MSQSAYDCLLDALEEALAIATDKRFERVATLHVVDLATTAHWLLLELRASVSNHRSLRRPRWLQPRPRRKKQVRR